MAKKGQKQIKYSPEYKISVIIDMRMNHLGYEETVRKYWQCRSGEEKNYTARLKLWERIYLEEGPEGLMKERRGRTTKAESPRVGKPKKLRPDVELDLIAENQRLKMENEYLKKLMASTQREVGNKNAQKRS